VEYVDLGDPASIEVHAAVLQIIEERGLPYPLVAVNGVLRLAGSADYSHLLPLVEESLASHVAA
jgi:hypothetical protein